MKVPQYLKALFYTLGESQFLKDTNPDISPVYLYSYLFDDLIF